MMKRIITYIAFIAAVFSSASCDEKIETKLEDFTFSINVTQLYYNAATIKVTHNGNEDVTWYGFLTSDINKSDFDLLNDVYMEVLTSKEFPANLNRTKERVFLLENLKEEKTYKYIVFGINEDGSLAKTGIASTLFTTPHNYYVLTEKTDVWSISYKRNTEKNIEEITVKSSRDKGYFDCRVYSEAQINDWNKFNPEGEKLVDENGVHMATVRNGFEMYAMQSIYDIQNQLEYGFEISEIAATNKLNGVQLQISRLSAGVHYAIIVGYNKDGQHTQEFSVHKIEISEDASATEEYLNWCGNYELTGKIDIRVGDILKEDQEITYKVRLEKEDNNHMYKLIGWECGDVVKNQWDEPIPSMGFNVYFNNGNLELRENAITTIEVEDYQYTLGIYGYGYNESTYSDTPVFYEGTVMALAKPIAEGEDSTTFEAQQFEYSYYAEDYTIKTKKADYTQVGLIAVNSSWAYMSKNPPLKFPLTLKKVSE